MHLSSTGWVVVVVVVHVGDKDADVYRVSLAPEARWVDFFSSEVLCCYQLGLC